MHTVIRLCELRIFLLIWRESSKTNCRKEMTKAQKMDWMSETKMSEPKCPAVLVIRWERHKAILSLSHPPVLIFLALPSLHLGPLLQSKIRSVIGTVTLSFPQCNIPLKVTAIVCWSKTKRKKCQAVKTKDKTLFFCFNHKTIWSSLSDSETWTIYFTPSS